MENKKPYCPFSEPADVVIDRISNAFYLKMFLQSLRSSQHYRQEDIAALSGLSLSTVSRLENGGNINLNNLIRYAHALGYELRLVKKEDNHAKG